MEIANCNDNLMYCCGTAESIHIVFNDVVIKEHCTNLMLNKVLVACLHGGEMAKFNEVWEAYNAENK